MFVDPAEKRAAVPSWIISALVHAGLVVLLLFGVSRMPQGSAEQTARDVGIVLKQATSDGVQFEGEEDNLADQTADTNTQNPTPSDPLEALPDVATQSNSADALPTLTSVGPAANTGASAAAAAAEGGTTGGARGDVGDKATVPFFGVTGTGTKFVYLVDRSGSMYGPSLAAAKQQLIESLNSLEEIHQFQIIFFNIRAQPLTLNNRNRMPFGTEQNKKLAAKLVQGVSADMSTERLLALKTALRLGPDVVFFLTDIDNAMDRDEIDEVVRLNRRHNAMICTIEFGRGPAKQEYNFLKELAERTGGQYGYVNTYSLGR